MLTVDETITTVKRNRDNHNGAGFAEWRKRIIVTLSLIVLIAAVVYSMQRSGAMQ